MVHCFHFIRRNRKMKRIFMGILFVALFFSVLVNCGKRENPVRTIYQFREPWKIKLTFSSLQDWNIEGYIAERWVYVYLPPKYDLNRHYPLLNRGFPVLYLLHDFGGDNETFYNIYKVQQIADRLIAQGEIQPMIIVIPDASNSLGGSFYTNSNLIGRYEDYIVNELMDIIDTTFHTVAKKDPDTDEIFADRRYKAISGHGMGGYGAFKIALGYDTTLFQSVSALSPILSFESFLNKEMIHEIFKENGIADDDSSYLSYKTITPIPSEEKPLTSIVFAMAAAFSPHDINDTDPDDFNFFELLNDAGNRYGVDLPFDSTRTVHPGSEIWDKWMYHDVKTQFAKKSGGGFKELKVYFDCGDSDQLKLYEGARAFHRLLSQYGVENTYIEYPGYTNYPAGHSNFIFDRLPEILKFHSRHFPPPTWQ